MWEAFAIRQDMPVYGSCGARIGTVAGFDNGYIRVTRDAEAGGGELTVPRCWVDAVGRAVRLTRSRETITCN
jgi:hypothetical protein